MGSASTSRARRAPRRGSRRPRRPAKASAPESASHSACQAPIARSCSWGSAASRRGDRRAAGGHRREQHRGDRVALVGHGRGAARRRLGHLGDLGLAEQRDVARDLRDPPAVTPARRRARRSGPGPRARGAAGRRARAGAEWARPRRVTGRRAGRACPRRRRTRPRAGRADPDEPRGARRGARQPAGRLQPERGRHRVLEQRPPGHRRRDGAGRAGRHSAARGSSSAQTRPSPRRATSMAAVSITSWLVAPKWKKAADARPAASAQPTDERDDRVHGGAALPGPPVAVEELGSAAVRDRGRGSGGIAPAGAAAFARARSTASMAASQARSETASRSVVRHEDRPGSRSEREENGLPVALEPDVERRPSAGRAATRVGAARRDRRRAAGRQRSPPPRRGSTGASARGFSRPRAKTSSARCGACGHPGPGTARLP